MQNTAILTGELFTFFSALEWVTIEVSGQWRIRHTITFPHLLVDSLLPWGSSHFPKALLTICKSSSKNWALCASHSVPFDRGDKIWSWVAEATRDLWRYWDTISYLCCFCWYGVLLYRAILDDILSWCSQSLAPAANTEKLCEARQVCGTDRQELWNAQEQLSGKKKISLQTSSKRAEENYSKFTIIKPGEVSGLHHFTNLSSSLPFEYILSVKSCPHWSH